MKKLSWIASLAFLAVLAFPAASFATTYLVSRIPTSTGNTFAVAFVPGQSKAYSTNSNAGTVSVVNTSSRTSLGTTIPVGSRPNFVSVNSNGTFALVSNTWDSSVSVIDVSTNSVTHTITDPNWYIVRGTAFLPGNTTALVADSGNNAVAFVNAALGTANPVEITVGVSPEYIGITPNGAFAYVANFGSNNVSVINLQTNTVIATIPVGTQPSWVAITPDGTKALVLNWGSDSISVIDTVTNTVVTTVSGLNEGASGSLSSIALTTDGRFAYISRQYETHLSVIDMTTMTLTAPVEIGVTTYGVSVSSTGGQLLTANLWDNSVSLIDFVSNVTPSSSSPPINSSSGSAPQLASTGAPLPVAFWVSSSALLITCIGISLKLQAKGYHRRNHRGVER
ncbi:YVTN family beta-propeller protein [Aurantimicrobium minutum]|uniref:YncE family protein n=1 Tax=Aurantimicrobium minutum TaxID=708131 RepID=UPI0024062F19|nr:YncE family protein [Aurantimicrobium minutum]MDF9809798.1 YVTN family beta-propeller protein [Aurantimicrobium minutum]